MRAVVDLQYLIVRNEPKEPIMNRKHALNVFFSDVIRNQLTTRGKSLSAEELSNELKTAQVLFEKSAFQYNLKNVPA